MPLELHLVTAIAMAFVWTLVGEPRANFELEIGENYITKRDVGDSNATVIERRDLQIKERSAGIFSRFSGLEINYSTGWPWYRRRWFFIPDSASGYSQIKAELLRQI